MGEGGLAGLLDREREGENPRTISSLRAERKPCFFSISGLVQVSFSDLELNKLKKKKKQIQEKGRKYQRGESECPSSLMIMERKNPRAEIYACMHNI